MTRLVILGSTGMLGSEVLRVASDSDIEVVPVSRASGVRFDAQTQLFASLATELRLSPRDWVVNCIGWIPQKSSGDDLLDQRVAWLLNSSLLEQISETRENLGFNWIQIGTDCVYDGQEGGYIESSQKNGNDLYGLTKIAGEEFTHNAMLIRTSIIGRDTRTSASLYSWFKQAISQSEVSGYVNHFWNGVSTTAFSHLVLGLIDASQTRPFYQHWVPRGQVSKYELLSMFADLLGLDASRVVPVDDELDLDRTLATSNQGFNEELWSLAGYNQEPSIMELCREFIALDKQLGNT
jgi:dTDP-4-dehydrorhamnose reductase